MRSVAALVLMLVAAGCAGRSAPTPAPSQPAIARGEALEGSFRLVFELPQATSTASETIEGVATLGLVDRGEVALGGSGEGLIGFAFAEVGGARHVDPIWTADCAPHRLRRDVPMTSPIKKSGGFSDDQPGADFVRAFLADPLLRLPAGDWEITAIASFIEGEGCRGASHMMRATVRVHVVP